MSESPTDRLAAVPRTAPIPLPTTYPQALTAVEERVAEAVELHLAGRLSPVGLVLVLRRGPWARAQGPLPGIQAHVLVCLAWLRRQSVAWQDRMAEPCPVQATPCTDGPSVRSLCDWHGKTLRRWWNVRDPVVRALCDPRTLPDFAARLTRETP